jgi:PTH2 family peptidyl-tRNA hydrolase
MNTKQVIVLRKDLGMRKGKLVAQGAHASMKVLLDRSHFGTGLDGIYCAIELTDAMKAWIEGIFTKICVSVNSEYELLDIYNQAVEANIPSSLVQDCGLTEFHGIPTYTGVAVGPDEIEKIDKITGHLPLF